MIKRILLTHLAILVLALPALAQDLKLPAVSQKSSISQTVGLTDITIVYHRPGVKGRQIWGDLVPYDKVWRTGANEATTIEFSTDVTIGGQKVPAGKYSLHTIPGKTEWTIIFNKVAEQWGSYEYDASKDALRIKAVPAAGPHQEWLTFSFPDIQQNSAVIEIAWEKVRVPFKVEMDTNTLAMANIKSAMEAMSNWTIPYGAAEYVFRAKTDKAQAMEWIDRSIALKETYWNLRLKADMLAADEKTAEAIAVAEKAVRIGKENKDEPGEVAKTEKQIADWKAAAKK